MGLYSYRFIVCVYKRVFMLDLPFWWWILPLIDGFCSFVFGIIGWLVISIFVYKQNPFLTEKGKVGDYISWSKYSQEGRKIINIEASAQEIFGTTSNTVLAFEKDMLAKKIKEQDKQLSELNDKLKKVVK